MEIATRSIYKLRIGTRILVGWSARQVPPVAVRGVADHHSSQVLIQTKNLDIRLIGIVAPHDQVPELLEQPVELLDGNLILTVDPLNEPECPIVIIGKRVVSEGPRARTLRSESVDLVRVPVILDDEIALRCDVDVTASIKVMVWIADDVNARSAVASNNIALKGAQGNV